MRARSLLLPLVSLAACATPPRPPPPRPPPPVVRAPPPVVPEARVGTLRCSARNGLASRAYDHVVIVSFDGMRPDGMQRANAPVLRRLSAEGAYAENAQTIAMSSTLPSHSAMLAGVDVDVHGMDFDEFIPSRGYIQAPTSLLLVHRAGMASAMFVSKDKLRHIATPDSLDAWALPGRTCARVARAAASYISDARPGETFIHFSEPDVAGHRHGWMSRHYLHAIARADRCLGTVVAAIEARTDRTLLIVTSDHGGHDRVHSTGTPVDRRIPWVAWGPCVRRGPFEAAMNTVDTAATVLDALGVVPDTGMTGRVVRAAFDPNATTSPASTSVVAAVP